MKLRTRHALTVIALALALGFAATPHYMQPTGTVQTP